MFLNKIIPILHRILNFATSLSYGIVFTCIIGMTFLVVTDALMRALFRSSIKGATEMSTYLLVIIGFLGVVLANTVSRHITITFLTERLPLSIRNFIEKINYIILISLSFLLLYSGIQKAFSAFYAGESEWFGSYIFPVWFFRFVVPVAFFLLFWQFMIDLFQRKKNDQDFEEK